MQGHEMAQQYILRHDTVELERVTGFPESREAQETQRHAHQAACFLLYTQPCRELPSLNVSMIV